MHVILTILKILGILLLILIGIVLAIVLSVLFVPVRYRVEGEKSSPGWESANGTVTVSWLLHLLHLRAEYQEKQLRWECYLFGVPLKKAGARIKQWKKKRRKKQINKKKETHPDDKCKKSIPAQTGENKDSDAKETEPGKIEQKKDQLRRKEPENKQSEDTGNINKQSTGKIRSIRSKCKKIAGSILEFPGKIKKKLTNLRLTFRGFYDKIKQWRSLWKEESTQAALHFLTEKGRKMIRHILPRTIRGVITFGCEDPAMTGQILAVVAMGYPLYGKGVKIYPRFEEKILEGNLQMKGRIVAAGLLWQAWKVYRNPDVRETIKKIR